MVKKKKRSECHGSWTSCVGSSPKRFSIPQSDIFVWSRVESNRVSPSHVPKVVNRDVLYNIGFQCDSRVKFCST